MTQNDVGYWKRMSAASATSRVIASSDSSDTQPSIYYQQIQPTDGIVLDQKVLVGMILILGIVAGITIMLVVDKYSSKK
jgi:hypothetical protein